MLGFVLALFLALGLGASTTQPPNTTQCSSFQNCGTCTKNDQCVWCLSQSACTSVAECPLTPYTDCCYLLQSCSECVLDTSCKYCSSSEGVQFCQQSNQSASSCPQAEDVTCANPSYSSRFFQSFLYGIFIVVGSSLLLLSMGLFIFYIYTQHKKNLAKKELEKLYHDKNEVTETIAVYETKLSERPQDGYTTLAPLIMRLND